MIGIGNDFSVDKNSLIAKEEKEVLEISLHQVETRPLVKQQFYNGIFKLSPPVDLEICCFYTFESKSLIFRMSNQRENFTINSVAVSYYKQQVATLVPKINGNMSNFVLSIEKIDRHVFEPTFTINVTYSVACTNFKLPNNMVMLVSTYTFDIPFFQKRTDLLFVDIPKYHTADEVKDFVKNNMKCKEGAEESQKKTLETISKFHKLDKKKLDAIDYKTRVEMFRHALSIEDLETRQQFRLYSRKSAQIQHHDEDIYRTSINVKSTTEKLKQCWVILRRFSGKREMKFIGTIDEVDKKIIYFKFKGKLDCSVYYRLDIEPGRMFHIACNNALDFVEQKNLFAYLEKFETFPAQQCRKIKTGFRDFKWRNKDIEENQEQKLAVQNIVNCTAFPFPYVVFGPPGTGKTTTLVEAIIQILEKKPKNKILVTAQSNSTCDEIGVRLLKFLSRTKILRWYAKSMIDNIHDLDEDLVRLSNIRNEILEQPSYEEFSHFQVVLVTLVSSKCLHRSLISSDHFDYIFIDECASSVEPESLIPITGMGSTKENITASIVLFGDHKQLGPVLKSPYAAGMGLDESLMERVMKQKNYLKNPEYNTNYVSQLLDNYRSHPAIMGFSNGRYYDSGLRSKAKSETINKFCNWEYLPNKNFPVIFRSTMTNCEMDEDLMSWHNYGEINKVNEFVRLLLSTRINGKKIRQEDIGIMSPYRSQVNLLCEKFQRLPNIEIGVVENFQGREKDIIIFSTVRSRSGVGFLRNEKRLNVALTRAKCLMVIIGNPETLQKASAWREYLRYCSVNNAIIGKEFVLKDPVKEVTDEEDSTDKSN